MWPPAGERRRHDPRVGKRLRTDWPSRGAAVATGRRLRSLPDRRGDYQRERCRLLPSDDAGRDHSPDQLSDDDRGRQSDEDRGGSETLCPVVAAPGENLDAVIGEMKLHPVPSNFISWIQRSPLGTLSIEVASAGSMKPG